MQRHISLFSLAALVTFSSCNGDPDTRLFDETGVWAMTHFSLDGAMLTEVPANTELDAFLLKFDPNRGVVAAAACAQGSGSAAVGVSTCRRATTADDRTWLCRCYAYDYDESTMNWTEFAPGDEPPMPGGGGGTGGEDANTPITLSEFTEVNNSYQFQPMPDGGTLHEDGLFESDGMTSRYIFLKRAETLFVESGCEEVCGGSSE